VIASPASWLRQAFDHDQTYLGQTWPRPASADVTAPTIVVIAIATPDFKDPARGAKWIGQEERLACSRGFLEAGHHPQSQQSDHHPRRAELPRPGNLLR